MPSVESTVPSLSLSSALYEQLGALVYEVSRIKLSVERRNLVAGRVKKRLQKLQLENFEAYFDYLLGPKGEEELPHLIEAISTHHTYFYRESAHFDFVRETIVPELKSQEGNRLWRFWSAACSTGEEPATLAMTLAEAGASPKQFHISASDIAPATIRKASQMVFQRNTLHHLPGTWQQRYFQKGMNQWRDYCRLVPSLRNTLDFHTLNLAHDFSWDDPFDAIFLRNVIGHFDHRTQSEILNRIVRVLRPGGYLFIGQSESLPQIDSPLSRCGPSVYQNAL
jgi:chemotaxis protein methyltransferase CheR